MEISFLHCSDLHLGFSQFGLEERFQDFGQSFRTIAEVAIGKQVQYLVISGDFFNKRSINSQTLAQADEVFSLLRENSVQVIAIEGNHDKAPYGEGDSWMRYLHERGSMVLLQPEFHDGKLVLNEQCVAEFPGIRFVGLGYLGSMTARRLAELRELLTPSEDFTVLLLHAAVDMLYHLGGVKRSDLDGLEELVDYVALGHIHGRYEREDWIYNPGAPEAWDLGEFAQEKGCYYVQLGPEGKMVEFIPSTPRKIYNLKIDLSQLTNPLEIGTLCVEKLQNMWGLTESAAMVRLELTGEVSFNPLAINQSELVSILKESFPLIYVEVLNQTVLKGQRVAELTDAQFNREQIESIVLGDLIKRNFAGQEFEDDSFITAGIELAQALKELSVAGDHDGMLSLIKNWTQEWGKEGHKNEN